MRQIKYRAKDISDKSWLYGCICYGYKTASVDEGNKETYISYSEYIPNQGYVDVETAVDPVTIGQFTGLYDANGNEIYEGDYLRFHGRLSTTVKEVDLRILVVWDEKSLLFGYKEILGDKSQDHQKTGLLIALCPEQWTIDGNVHED